MPEHQGEVRGVGGVGPAGPGPGIGPDDGGGPVPDRFGDLRRRAAGIGSGPLPEYGAAAGPGTGAVPAPDRWETAQGTASHRFGLVLAGGAAKGAYQVGAVECLAHHGARITAIAGTSIGALNGVALAGAPNLREGAARLAELWRDFTSRMGDAPFGTRAVADGAVSESLLQRFGNLAPRVVRLLGAHGDLERLADRAIDAAALRRPAAVTMRVAAYPVLAPHPLPHLRAGQMAAEWLAGLLGSRSRILHLNGLEHAEIKEAVLGSAALPFLFAPRQVAGEYYRDGMLGRDNTPIRALADLDHCDIVIVVQLAPGETVRQIEHPGLTLLRVRPSRPLTPEGTLGTPSGLLDFSPAAFERLRSRGYEDTERLLARTAGLLGAAHEVRVAEEFMADAVQRVIDKGRRLRGGP
ncbi:patatin-like phospholipase family protein [Streptomyces sp. NBC_00510]